MNRVGVLLSGCGVFDGAEIQESVLTLLALDRAGAKVQCLAPNIEQMHVVNHLTGEPTAESRNVLVESARIARGEIRDLAEVGAADFDALILPGGFGAAKNLSNFAIVGKDAEVHPEVTRILREMLAAKKPIGVACIAPAVMAAVLRDMDLGGTLTIGSDPAASAAIGAMGIDHKPCGVEDLCIDEANGIVSTPAYMLASSLSEVAKGLENMVLEVLRRTS